MLTIEKRMSLRNEALLALMVAILNLDFKMLALIST